MPYLTPRNDQPTTRLARLGVAVLCLLWLLIGLIGHDPWKADDALHLGVAFGMDRGDWLVPRIAGDPWLVSPPLYHWVATVCGKLLGWLLPWHDAARMATAVFGCSLLFVLYRVAHISWGASTGLAAPLLAIGTLGLLTPMHEAEPVVVALTGFAIALLGLTLWRERTTQGGMLFGTGVGVAFLGSGLEGILPPLLTGILIQLHPAWQSRRSIVGWLLAIVTALALILPWPLLLEDHSQTLFDLWWSAETGSLSGNETLSVRHFKLLAWAAWPVLPIALWALWQERKRLSQPQTALPLVASVATLALFLASEPKITALLPALVPLSLLAAAGAGRLRRGAANAFDWFGMITFTLLAGLVWLGGVAILTGEPAKVAKNFSKPAPDFVATLSIPAMLFAIAVTVGWIAVMLRTPRTPWRAAARWSVGLTATWLLLNALWLPWMDHVRTYRGVSADFHRTMGSYDGCIVRRDLGLAQRASLDYFSGIRTVSQSNSKGCRYLIAQAQRGKETAIPGWKLLLEKNRPGDKTERLRLYRRSE